MTPLDLTKTPPRKAACADGGMIYLGRTIDKVRASLPGGNPGPFIVGSDEVPTTMSLYLFRVLKTDEEEFRDVVGRAASEDDVVAWVRSKATPEKIARWNAWIDGFRIKDLPPENVDFFLRSNATARGLPSDTLVIDALDYEDSADRAQ
jgi:hypothetical protein